DRFLCGSPHLGAESEPPSSFALCHSGRRPVARWHTLDLLPAGFLSARPCPVSFVPPPVSSVSRRGLPIRQAGVLRIAGALSRLHRPVEADQVGRLRQPPFCRPPASTRLRWPLYAPRRDFQQPPARYRRGQCPIPVEGLP